MRQKAFVVFSAVNFTAGRSYGGCPTEGNIDHKPADTAHLTLMCITALLHFGRGYVTRLYLEFQ